jgi:AcrR family transcriptional regulator
MAPGRAVAVPAGRRPGGHDTRAEIVAAAGQVFSEVGYERASIRGIARRAGVDAALVHHYFGDKAQLFVELVQLPRDLAGEILPNQPTRSLGNAIVRRFLSVWESSGSAAAKARFSTLLGALAASPQTAEALREFLMERVWSRVKESPRQRAQIAAQLWGMAFVRYVLVLEPVASADPDQLAEWFGPVIDFIIESGAAAATPTDAGRNGAAALRPDA